MPLEIGIFEVLIGLLEVEKLGLDIEACHLYDFDILMLILNSNGL
jgi:hypothetical protein